MFLLAVVILVVIPALGASLVERSQTAVERPIPASLVICCCSDVVSVQLSGNASFYGGLYAPQAETTLNAGNVCGSIVGKDATPNGANGHIHCDETLRDHSSPNAVMRSWEVL